MNVVYLALPGGLSALLYVQVLFVVLTLYFLAFCGLGFDRLVPIILLHCRESFAGIGVERAAKASSTYMGFNFGDKRARLKNCLRLRAEQKERAATIAPRPFLSKQLFVLLDPSARIVRGSPFRGQFWQYVYVALRTFGCYLR